MKSESELVVSPETADSLSQSGILRVPMACRVPSFGPGPMRAELYGLEALESHARELAAACAPSAGRPTRLPGTNLLQRLRGNQRLLTGAVKRIGEWRGAGLSPDAEWLIDNFYVIEEVLKEVRRDLPRGYYRELPRVATGTLAGYPRVYALALALIAHTDSGLDEDHVTRFVEAYQSETPLTIGELWAVPTMLRLGLLENLRRLAQGMLLAWDDRDRADDWVGAVPTPNAQESAEPAPPPPREAIPTLPGDAFVVRVMSALRDAGPPEAFEKLRADLAARGIDPVEVVRRENQRQAVDQVSVGNCVTSLRLLTALDWGKFFEKTNLVDPELQRDPAGVYGGQDFPTRDRYRRAVERLARRARLPEIEVARRAVRLAAAPAPSPADDDACRTHVGYYLIGAGLPLLEADVGCRRALGGSLLPLVLARPGSFFFGGLALLMALLLAGVWALLGLAGEGVGVWAKVAVLFAAALPLSEVAVGLVNYLVTLFVPPRVLPKLEFRDGIPADCAAVVVMPSMLSRPRSAVGLLERLEIHFLANPDPQLRFALLTDFTDAAAETTASDDACVQAALEGIAALNLRHCEEGPPRFFLFHRRRLWNPSQNCWMGWERKRGKLAEFNRLIRGDRSTSYATCSGDPADFAGIRYVITLDSDTQLPRDAARRLVGTLAHPLNRAHFDPSKGRVAEGYSILQPRVSLHAAAARRSHFTRIWSQSAGIDPYSTAVSDVYQDLFGAGSFTGKGIYDLDAFEAATGNAFPDNRVLSHDLIEGNYARCGLVTDIEVFDDFPARHHAYARREHRWIRGDWQLLPWLGRRVPLSSNPEGHPEAEKPANPPTSRANPLPLLERWKVLDNLRRSLVPPAIVLWLLLGWTVLASPWWLTTGVAALVLTLPFLLYAFGTAMHSLRSASAVPLREFRRNGPTTLIQVGLGAAFLLNQAYLCVDAIVRTLVRMFVTRKNLLEWETAAAAERRLGEGLRDFVRVMIPAMLLALEIAFLVYAADPSMLWVALPFVLAWLVSPVLAWRVSQSLPPAGVTLTASETQELRTIARSTWGFFETFVGPEDNWLPPDNFQEEPRGVVAHRTSPTNKGLLVLSTLAAHDFGYVGTRELADRLEKTFDSLDRLERYRGHFLNWYDTRTLEALQPAYVSTVDSGNLMGCLLALKQGLLEKCREPVAGPWVVEGLRDTLTVLAESILDPKPRKGLEADSARVEVRSAIQNFVPLLVATPANLSDWRKWLLAAIEHAEVMVNRAAGSQASLGSAADTARVWADRLRRSLQARLADLDAFAGWLPMLDEPDPSPIATDPEWAALRTSLTAVAPLDALAEGVAGWKRTAETLAARPGIDATHADFLRRLSEAMTSTAGETASRLRRVADRADALADAPDFRFLYRPDRHLFGIGYNVPQGRFDPGNYDLLASEARMTSFLGVARGDAPAKHWFHLGRLVVRVDSRLCLVSWSGTMFEYLMPELLLRRYPGTLLAESCEAAVEKHMSYGSERGVPWGISESAYSSRFTNLDHQYQAFGVPGLGLKRGLGDDLVIAPYATALAAMVRPRQALENFRRLAGEGAYGRHGFYEAIDYTRERLPEGRRSLVVKCYMAHHQGMSLLALANALLGDPMPRRFHTDPLVRATELLLQEKVPTGVDPVESPGRELTARESGGPGALSRRLTTADTAAPRTHLLSNGRYSVMLTNAGGGYSRCEGADVTRWREDATRDDSGQFIYVRDITDDRVWSVGHQPVCRTPEFYEVVYSADKAEFRRLDGGVATHLEVTVCPENRAEVRMVRVTNQDDRVHEVELTSYLEPVLAAYAADRAHPAFGKLFLETEWVAEHGALLCRRRPREAGQRAAWAVHAVGGDGALESPQFETDRAKFLGRGRTTSRPAALDRGVSLSNTSGAVLDPVLSLRRRVRLEPGQAAVVMFCTAVADGREDAIALADHYCDPQAALRVFDLAWAHSQIELRHLRISSAEAHLYQRVAAHLLYTGLGARAAPDVLARNRQGQQGLWRYGISGDRPILLARIADHEEMPLARQLLTAHAYWRLRGLEVDLVFLCEEATGYYEDLFRELQQALRGSDSQAFADKPGGVFIRKADHLPEDDKVLLQAYSRVLLVGYRGSLASQLGRAEGAVRMPARLPLPRNDNRDPVRLPDGLSFANGVGGFTPSGHEYCILPYRQADGRYRYAPPPAPWVNVIANPALGFIVSESSLGYTWAGNSQLNRLTPWSNDPVSDAPGEVVYLRDTDTGDVWSPTPLPRGWAAPVLVHHGQGYTRFERRGEGLAQDLTVLVAPTDPVKLLVLKVKNTGDRPRRLSATYYAEWVLGVSRDQAPLGVRSWVGGGGEGAMFAENPMGGESSSQVAFADVDVRPRTFTADRSEILGRNGGPATPAGLARPGLSGRIGAGLDPCAAVQAEFALAPGEERTITFFLGAAATLIEAERLAKDYREPGRADAALAEVRAYWAKVLGSIEVETPDPAMDLLVNRWLPYQVLSCRLWGRSGFYQSGGAYGFRDQLQDCMALVYGAPEVAREHLLRAASRQFVEGDVQHWWHPPGGRGVRTHFSDDFLWLPFAVGHYVSVTGDTGVMAETVPFLRAPRLTQEQESVYGQPDISDEVGTLYEHCVRSLRNGLKFGERGLPLMGCGDWNDGMNRVGAAGKGETVWGAWFLLTCLRQFADLAEARADTAWAGECRSIAETLRESVEANAWDGDWYRRAYFDDGTPLGSAGGEECRIDSIAQSWAVISGGGEAGRARRAMDSVDQYLVKSDPGLILLFDPPFDRGSLEPGYIKGYLPGVRENGGQYTHAAVWVVQAHAMLGEGARAAELFSTINPIRHSSTPADVARYKVEPYVVAADVYGVSPHTGRGGWTWYTGSASWLFRVALESLLGFRLRGDRATFAPCVPPEWPGFSIRFRYHSATYRVELKTAGGAGGAWKVVLDGAPVEGEWLPLTDDGREHRVEVSR